MNFLLDRESRNLEVIRRGFCFCPGQPCERTEALRLQAEGEGQGEANLKLWRRASALVAVAESRATREKAAETYNVGLRSVFLWQSRFLVNGVAGLLHKPRPGKKRRLSDEQMRLSVHTP
jgi:hypothetical protein